MPSVQLIVVGLRYPQQELGFLVQLRLTLTVYSCQWSRDTAHSKRKAREKRPPEAISHLVQRQKLVALELIGRLSWNNSAAPTQGIFDMDTTTPARLVSSLTASIPAQGSLRQRDAEKNLSLPKIYKVLGVCSCNAATAWQDNDEALIDQIAQS